MNVNGYGGIVQPCFQFPQKFPAAPVQGNMHPVSMGGTQRPNATLLCYAIKIFCE